MVQEDVERGCQGSIFGCPVARAAQRAFRKHKPEWVNHFHVQSIHLCVEIGPHRYAAQFPREVREWIRAYDTNMAVAGMQNLGTPSKTGIDPLPKFTLRFEV